MSLAVLSINHHEAPVAIREKVAFQTDEINQDLHHLKTQQGIQSCVILSTCNRSEVYVHSSIDNADVLKQTLITWLSDKHRIDAEILTPFLSFFYNQTAVEHLAHVACGLHSLVVGEPQILGQLKAAYYQAKDNQCLDKTSERLFQHTFSVAKKIRTQTKIGSSPISIAYCSVKLAERIFTNLSEKNVLLIGAGEMIELAAQHLMQHGIHQLIIANRTVEKANIIAHRYQNASSITLNKLPNVIHQADIILSSTASPVPIIGKGLIESALKERKHKPIFMVDMAIPRDIEPEVANLDDAYLYTLDDLADIVEHNTQLRQQESTHAKEIIDSETQSFQQWLNTLPNDELIERYRKQAETIKDNLVEEALKKLNNGLPPQQLFKMLADKLTNQLTHQPSKALKQNDWHNRDDIKQIIESLLIKK